MGFRVMCSYVWITVPAFTGWVTLYITQFASLWLSFHISRIETIIIIVYSLLVYISHRVVMRIKWSKVWEIFQWVPGTWLVYILLTYPHFVVKEAKAERDKKAVTRSHISKHQSLNSNPGLSYSKAHILDLHTRLPPFPTGFAPWRRREEGKLVSPQHKCALPLNLFLESRWQPDCHHVSKQWPWNGVGLSQALGYEDQCFSSGPNSRDRTAKKPGSKRHFNKIH